MTTQDESSGLLRLGGWAALARLGERLQARQSVEEGFADRGQRATARMDAKAEACSGGDRGCGASQAKH